MLTFKFNPEGTQNKDPGAFHGVCELVNIIYTTSKKGYPMIKLTWNYEGNVFHDYHTCFDEKHKDVEAQWIGSIYWKLGENPQQVIDGYKPETLDDLLKALCNTMTEQLRFKATINREKRDGSSFYDVFVDLNEPIIKV